MRASEAKKSQRSRRSGRLCDLGDNGGGSGECRRDDPALVIPRRDCGNLGLPMSRDRAGSDAPESAAAVMASVVSALAPALKVTGFKKRRHTFNRIAEPGLVHVVNFQMGQFPIGAYEIPGLRPNLYGRFTVNLGVFVREVYEATQRTTASAFVQEYACEFRVRLGRLLSPPGTPGGRSATTRAHSRRSWPGTSMGARRRGLGGTQRATRCCPCQAQAPHRQDGRHEPASLWQSCSPKEESGPRRAWRCATTSWKRGATRETRSIATGSSMSPHGSDSKGERWSDPSRTRFLNLKQDGQLKAEMASR